VARQIKLGEEHKKEMEWSKETTENFQKLNEQVALAWNTIEKDFVTNLKDVDLKPFVTDIEAFGKEAATVAGELVTMFKELEPYAKDAVWVVKKGDELSSKGGSWIRDNMPSIFPYVMTGIAPFILIGSNKLKLRPTN
jgi:hypothetical protein